MVRLTDRPDMTLDVYIGRKTTLQLFPAETVVLGEELHAETISAESLDRKQNHTDSLCRKPFFVDGNLGRKQEITDSLAEAKKDRLSLQEAKISGLVYTL